MGRLALGIGDLHLDTPLSKYIPDCNSVIMSEVEIVVEWGLARGIKQVILYGDIGDKPRLSDEAHRLLLALFYKYSQVKFIVVKGNHDVKSDEHNGLNVLNHLQLLGGLPNVKFVLDKPTLLFENSDTPVYVLPWPYSKTKAGVLNVLHTEVNNAVWDTGRSVVVDNKVDTRHLSVIGHIHTKQRVGNAHFSGTLYQTSFGEKPKKYFHSIDWTGDVSTSKVTCVPHVPKYTLTNVIINSKSDVRSLPTEPTNLLKVFVNKELILPDTVFDEFPNVVKHNYFGSKLELKALMKEELELDDLSTEVAVDLTEMLNVWLEKNNVDATLAEQAPSVISRLIDKARNEYGSSK